MVQPFTVLIYFTMQQLCTTINDKSIAIHQRMKDDLLSHRPVIMVVVGDHIRLIDNIRGTQDTIRHIPETWHWLKTIAHIGLVATYSTDPTVADKAVLREHINNICTLRETMDKFPEEMRKIQESILDQSAAILDFQKQSPDSILHVEQLIQNMKLNLEFATQLQLDSLHSIVQNWKALFTSDQWDQVAVVVTGGHQPRAGDITMQYFCRLTGKPLESFGSFAKAGYGTLWTPTAEEQSRKKSRVLVYAENITTFDAAIEVLKQNLLSMYASGPLLGQIHLDFDVLADAAFKRLHEKCTSHSK